jgi:hypothetical protein
MNLGMVKKQNEIYQYYSGTAQSHGLKQGQGIDWIKLFRCTQRIDGFVSADAPYSGGEFVTPVLEFQGDKLVLNIDTSALGQAQVEILDNNNCPINNFTIDEADLIQGNYVDKVVTWNGSSDLSSLENKQIKLKFVMKAAKLYSFKFTNAKLDNGTVK